MNETLNIRDRIKQADLALADLKALKNNLSFANQYAVDENIIFFQSCKTIVSYIWWLVTRVRKIDGKRILEINDFPVEHISLFDRELYEQLIQLQEKPFPGLIRQLVDRIVELIFEENRPMDLVGFGVGGMDVERQVIARLIEKNHPHRIVFVGVDKSFTAPKVARKNLERIKSGCDILEVDILDKRRLDEIKKSSGNKHIVVLSHNDIFDLSKLFPEFSFDLVYHSLFRHHLNHKEKEMLDDVSRRLSKNTLEFDGYYSFFTMLPQSIADWKSPTLLNGAIFSNVRYPTKKELFERKNKNTKVSFRNIGTYLLEFNYNGNFK